MILEAFAKINWTLGITGVRPDGYHLLDMLMQPVSLSDRITLFPSESLTLQVSGSASVPSDSTNLAFRAARLLQCHTGVRQGASILLEKQIPTQAGMGGGSSDAACVLVGLNEFWKTGLDEDELEKLGLQLGADVPFFIRGGLARSRGIGEVLERFPCNTFYRLVLVQPAAGLSTAEVFRLWHAASESINPDNPLALSALLSGKIRGSEAFVNVLEPVSRQLCPEIADIADTLSSLGADLSMMTGSGSVVFGAFSDDALCQEAFRCMKEKYGKVWLCHSQNESIRRLDI